jgi:hypothetical protein
LASKVAESHIVRETVGEPSPAPAFETPWAKPDREACRFYHSIDLPAESIEGDWDLRGKYADYTGNVSLEGCTVLDMGAASGAVSFYMEGMGAKVVSADVATAAQYTKVPYFDDPYVASPNKWLANAECGLRAMKNSYWYSWHSLGSSNRVYYGDLITIDRDIGLFDIAFIGQILVHNRDPLGIVQSAAMRTTGTVVISEGMNTAEDQTVQFLPGIAKGFRPQGWFRFSTRALSQFLELMGFRIRSIRVDDYACLIRKHTAAITTIVADRMPNTMAR